MLKNAAIRLVTTSIAILASVAPGQLRAEAAQVAVPVKSLPCLVENQQKYLELPRNVIVFFPSLCPAVSREEVASIVQNSAGDSAVRGTRSIMLKSEFSCLVDRISAALDEGAEIPEDPEAELTFTLDCS